MADTMVTNEDHPFGSEHSLIEEVLRTGRKVGAGRDFWATLAHDEQAFRRALIAVQGSAAPTTPDEAAAIMGSNFHGIDDVESKFGVKFTAKQRKLLGVVPFSAETLESCSETHILVAGAALSIMDVQARNKSMFYFKDDPWYGASDQRFASKTKVTVAWHLVRKTPLQGSLSKSWTDQQAMVSQQDYVPPACLVVFAVVLHAMVTGERLLGNVYVRTSDVTASGYRVLVGRFDSNGLFVTYWSERPYSYIGVAVSRKSN